MSSAGVNDRSSRTTRTGPPAQQHGPDAVAQALGVDEQQRRVQPVDEQPRLRPGRAAGPAGVDQERPDGDDHPADQPLEHAKGEHGGQRHQGDDEALVAQAPDPGHGGQVEEPEHGADHDRRKGRLGQVPEQRQQGDGGDHGQAGHQQRDQLGLGPGAVVGGRLAAPPPVMKPWNRPERMLAAPTARSSRSGSTV